MAPRAHIVGAGLAGLSAAIRLTEAGYRVSLFEAGPQAGGRCRSYFDETLGRRIDNGNHLLLSGNRSTMAYLRTIGAEATLEGPAEAGFPFVDLGSGERWTLRPGDGPIPFWVADPTRRVPGTRLLDYLGGLKILRARPGDTVAGLVAHPPTLFRRFWEPLAVAALNTETESAAAALLAPVLKETFGKGAAACRPLVAAQGLSESFVDPALAWLSIRGGKLFTGNRVRALGFEGDRLSRLDLGDETIDVRPADLTVLAVPPPIAAALVPDLVVPTEFRPIVNAHFRLPGPPCPGIELTGIVGGAAEWIFWRGELASVTISSATRWVDIEAQSLARRIWSDVAAVLRLDLELPPWRIVKEKRATFAQTPDQVRRRPGPVTRWRNLLLAGDWTDTGLPATIEGAIRSGEAAARAANSRPH